MNNTINKRTEEYGKQFIGMCSSYEAYAEREDVEKAYIQGANDQREIYREWLEKKCHEHPSIGTWEDIIADFRKVMESEE